MVRLLGSANGPLNGAKDRLKSVKCEQTLTAVNYLRIINVDVTTIYSYLSRLPLSYMIQIKKII